MSQGLCPLSWSWLKYESARGVSEDTLCRLFEVRKRLFVMPRSPGRDAPRDELVEVLGAASTDIRVSGRRSVMSPPLPVGNGGGEFSSVKTYGWGCSSGNTDSTVFVGDPGSGNGGRSLREFGTNGAIARAPPGGRECPFERGGLVDLRLRTSGGGDGSGVGSRLPCSAFLLAGLSI